MAFAGYSSPSSWSGAPFHAGYRSRNSWTSFSNFALWAPSSYGVAGSAPSQSLPKIYVLLNGNDVPHCAGFIRFVRNEPAEWSVTLPWHEDFAPSGGSYSGNLLGCGADRLSIVIERGGDTWYSPSLVQDDYQINFSTGEITIRGQDMSLLLQIPGQGLADVRSTATECVNATQALQSTLSPYGITKLDIQLPNRPIDTQIRLGEPLEIARTILHPFADWYFEEDVFTARPPGWETSPVWHFEERVSLEDGDYRRTPWAIRNRATVQRLEGSAASIGDMDHSGKFGQFTLQFDRPASHVVPQVLFARRGKIDTFTYIDEAGGALNNYAPANGGIYTMTSDLTPAAGVKFNYTPNPSVSSFFLLNGDEAFSSGGTGTFTPAFRIRFSGSENRSSNACYGAYDPEFTKTVTIPTSCGVRPFEAPFASESIPTGEWAALAARLYALEGAHQGESVRFRTQVCPWVMRPGQRLALTERRITKFNNKEFFLEAMTHSWDHRIDPKTGKITDSGTTEWEAIGIL